MSVAPFIPVGKVGDRFSVTVADASVLMEATGIRCGDVWDCNPVDPSQLDGAGHYYQPYGKPMVVTDDDLGERVEMHKRYSQ